jgi:general secretion pathway protein G
MNHSSPRNRQAFTLIELLVVITVIAILAGLVLNTAGYVQKKSARSRAEAEVAALSAAIESYKLDYGAYPSNSANGSVVLYQALVTNGTLNPSGKIYFEPNNSMVSGTGNSTSLIDPFGIAYNYIYPGNATRSGTNFFDLWSTAGATPATDTNQWIKNW